MPRLSKSSAVPTSITKPSSSSSSATILKTATAADSNKLTKPLQSSKSIKSNPTTSQTPDFETTPSPSSEPSFICTICWQSQHTPSKPKLLGTSSRIVCRPCWKAVLDLSICWVCGECIVRGDEVVSLGWCFWHRACFGCLVCGTRMDLREFEAVGHGGEWGSWAGVEVGTCGNGVGDGIGERGGGGREGKRKRMIGVELERVPLCETCEIETVGAPYGEVVERGLETVSRFDGGLSRDRLNMLSEEREERRRVSRSRWKRSQFRGSSGLERELKRFINGSASRWSELVAADDPEAQKALIKHAAELGISEDGNADEEHDHSDNEMIDFGQTNEESPPTVYVSVLDPLGEPAFKPSKTKPLPKWMSLLPNNVYLEREQERLATASEAFAHSHEIETLDGRSIFVDDCRCSEKINEETPTPSPNETTPRLLSRSSAMPVVVPLEVSDDSKSLCKSRVTISIDPKREHAYRSLGHRDYRESKATETTYNEYAPRQPSTRQKSPYPSRRRPSMTRSETTSYSSHGQTINYIPEEVEDSCCLLGANLQTPGSSPDSSPEETPSRISSIGYISLPSERHSPFVVHSSEYLDRYQPKAAETKYQKYVAKEPEPIIDKIRRQRVGRQSLGQVAEETVEKRRNSERGVELDNEEYGLDPTREDLKRELRNLFCEE